MAHHITRRKKPVLSAHQKQIRLLTGLSVGITLLFVVALFLLINWSGFGHH
jgi:hypothetical protein